MNGTKVIYDKQLLESFSCRVKFRFEAMSTHEKKRIVEDQREVSTKSTFSMINTTGRTACSGLSREWPVTPSLSYESFKVHPIYPSPFNGIVFTRVTCSKPCTTNSSFSPPRSIEILRCCVCFLHFRVYFFNQVSRQRCGVLL